MIGHLQLKLYHLKPETLKHVEIIKVQHITVYDTSLELSLVGDLRFQQLFLNFV